MPLQIASNPRKSSTPKLVRRSAAAGPDITRFDDAMASLSNSKSVSDVEAKSTPIGHKLFDVLVSAKVHTSKIAMHLDRDWRTKLFGQLDDLLSEDGWHEEDLPLGSLSYTTFLRMILYLRPARRPSLGLSSRGNIVAGWVQGSDRLILECLPNDTVQWQLSVVVDGERERVVAETRVAWLPDRLRSYGPERWFNIEAPSA